LSTTGTTRRTVIYALVVILILVTAAFAYYYFQSQSTLSQRNQQIANLESALAVQKLNATKLQLAGVKLNASIANLVGEISGLRANQSSSQLKISELVKQLGNYRNESALESAELGIIYQFQRISVVQLFLNTTMTVAPEATIVNAAGSGGGNWTLVFTSPKGCPITGIGETQGQSNTIMIFLNSTWPEVTLDAADIGTQPWTLEFQNISHAPVTCYFSMFAMQT
jgi:hypothetical protein